MIIKLIMQFVAAMIGTLGFAIIFSAPKKELIFCALNGAVGWVIYSLFVLLNLSNITGALIATIAVQFLARLFSVKRRNPVTIYLITGLFPMFPGSGLYYTTYYLLTKNPLAENTGRETLAITGAIILGIVIGSLFSEAVIKNKSSVKKQKSVVH